MLHNDEEIILLIRKHKNSFENINDYAKEILIKFKLTRRYNVLMKARQTRQVLRIIELMY